jgi:hypothetical protein
MATLQINALFKKAAPAAPKAAPAKKGGFSNPFGKKEAVAPKKVAPAPKKGGFSNPFGKKAAPPAKKAAPPAKKPFGKKAPVKKAPVKKAPAKNSKKAGAELAKWYGEYKRWIATSFSPTPLLSDKLKM